MAEQHGLDDGLAVDRHADRLADLQIVQRLVGVVDQQVVFAARGVEMDVEVGILLQLSIWLKGTKMTASSSPACSLSMRVLSLAI